MTPLSAVSFPTVQHLNGLNGGLNRNTIGFESHQSSGQLPFASLLNGVLQGVDQQQQQVVQSANDLASGRIDQIHDFAVNVAQADLSFRLVMEVRDKLISAYQEVMRMQV